MKYKIWLLLLVAAVAVCFALSLARAQADPTSATNNGAVSARSRFRLPRLFDFESFKQLFKRHYGSLLEEMARKRLFLARALRAFISAVGYKHRKSSYYLAVNQMSDWTLAEIKRMYPRAEMLAKDFKGLVAQRTSASGASLELDKGQEFGAVEEEAIERELAKVVTAERDEPASGAISEELELPKGLQRERVGRELSVDSLIHGPSTLVETREASDDSKCAESERARGQNGQAMAQGEAFTIGRLPGVRFVRSLLSSAVGALADWDDFAAR